ncbi:MAG: stage II sporulation protein R, partial [Firmicutes bacterium]|nr:stage II sporulation protein R [Bacillota bacterium]
MNTLKLIHDLKSLKNFIFITLKKDKIILLAALLLGLAVTFQYCKIYSNNTQNDISENILRFHILAQSNSENDQLLKMKVKEKILQKLEPKLRNASSKEDLLRKVTLDLKNIENWGRETLLEEGYDLAVKAELCKDYFPTKNYADISLP